ncbi:hypothetical protein PG991_001080 [Apiospora marii]|uniref:Uncharacterized protein n=1 Tax=Apiospora marii TaxID=335849 RepID=A0ABR1STV3_9PEZI
MRNLRLSFLLHVPRCLTHDQIRGQGKTHHALATLGVAITATTPPSRAIRAAAVAVGHQGRQLRFHLPTRADPAEKAMDPNAQPLARASNGDQVVGRRSGPIPIKVEAGDAPASPSEGVAPIALSDLVEPRPLVVVVEAAPPGPKDPRLLQAASDAVADVAAVVVAFVVLFFEGVRPQVRADPVRRAFEVPPRSLPRFRVVGGGHELVPHR